MALPVQTGSQIGTLSNFNYYPVLITGNQAELFFRNNVLAYAKTYYITFDTGVFTDSKGVLPGVSDPSVLRLSTAAGGPAAGATTIVVAADGSGDFATVQAAVDFIPAGNTTARTIFIRKGTYPEIVYFTGKHSLTFVGEDRFQTIISYPNNNTFNSAGGAYHRMVFNADHSNDIVIAHLTIDNTTPLGGSQAEALILNGTNSSRAIVTDVELTSYQDTPAGQRTGLMSPIPISPATPTTCGQRAELLLQLRIDRERHRRLLHPDPQSRHNDEPRECLFELHARRSSRRVWTLPGPDRPDGLPFSEVVYLNCAMGSHILPAGWLHKNATTEPRVNYWQNKSKDHSGNQVEVSQL